MSRPRFLNDPVTKNVIIERSDYEFLLSLSEYRQFSAVVRDMIAFYRNNHEALEKLQLTRTMDALRESIRKLREENERLAQVIETTKKAIQQKKAQERPKLVLNENDRKILADPKPFLRLFELCTNHTISQASFMQKAGMTYHRAKLLIEDEKLE